MGSVSLDSDSTAGQQLDHIFKAVWETGVTVSQNVVQTLREIYETQKQQDAKLDWFSQRMGEMVESTNRLHSKVDKLMAQVEELRSVGEAGGGLQAPSTPNTHEASPPRVAGNDRENLLTEYAAQLSRIPCSITVMFHSTDEVFECTTDARHCWTLSVIVEIVKLKIREGGLGVPLAAHRLWTTKKVTVRDVTDITTITGDRQKDRQDYWDWFDNHVVHGSCAQLSLEVETGV